MTYAIYSADESDIQEEPMYWSNELGWVSLDCADFFTQDEKNELNLPIGGQWIMMDDPLDPSWENDFVQFARLISEISATVSISSDDFGALKDSMDLTAGEINELFDRALDIFEASKQRIITMEDEDE